MKQHLLSAFAIVALLFAACGGGDDAPTTIPVSGIKLDKSSLSLEIGEKATLTATIAPSDATNKSITWSSANSSIATVNNGVVEGVATGETTITAKTNDGGFTATIPVKVVAQSVKVTAIKLVGVPTEAKEGRITTISAVITPTDATDMTVTFTSSNPDVVKVEFTKSESNYSLALLTAVGGGKAKITATANDGSGVKAEAEVTVIPAIKVSEIKIGPENATIEVGETKQFAVAISPADAENREVEWSSSDTSVATVDANGLVTGVATGEVTITATAKDGSGVKGTATAKVTDSVTALTFDGQTEAKFVTWHGNESDLKAAADGDLKTLKWVFTPDQDTEYTEVISSDKATITAWSNENTMQSVVNVSVGKQTGGGVLARASVVFRTTAGMYTASDYKYFAAWWIDDNNFSYTVTTAREKYYFVAYCAPLSNDATHDPEMYYPDSYIPTSAYTLTTNNDKVTVKKLNDKCYEITDSDLSTYKELVLTYTCGKQIFTYTTKIVPR